MAHEERGRERSAATHGADGRPRARGLRLALPGETGPLNAITDIAGLSVGMTTLIANTPEGRAVRTGVTAILPRAPDDLLNPIWAGFFSMNGNGEMTGSHWVREAGWMTGPILITNTFSLGIAHHAATRWMARRFSAEVGTSVWVLPVLGETFDGYLNDISGFHVTEEHALAAIDAAHGGPVAEGSVGGGTGMIAYEYKAGTGTASRRVRIRGDEHRVGALVQANHGLRPWLTVCGVPVGAALDEDRIFASERGSIIVILATDAPLLPTQLERLARRAAIGIGRGGTPSGNSSGDIFLAFSTANDPGRLPEPPRLSLQALSNDDLDPLFLAAVEAVDEAVLNAMLAADSMTGHDGHHAPALDHARLCGILRSKDGNESGVTL